MRHRRPAARRHAAAEHAVRQVAGQVERDTAAGAAGEAEHEADHRIALGRFDATGKALERGRHRPVTIVVGAAVGGLGQRPRLPFADARRRRLCWQPGTCVGVRVVHRVLELQEVAVARQRLLQHRGFRQRQGKRLDLHTAAVEAPGQGAHRAEVLLADVHRQRRQARAGHIEQALGRVAQELCDHPGTGTADTDEMHSERQRIGIGDAVHAALERIELALLQLGLGAADGRCRPAAQQVDSCGDCHSTLLPRVEKKKAHPALVCTG